MNNIFPVIDQKEIGRYYKNLLENPELNVDQPLVIWRAYFHDGILLRELHDVNSEYNEERNKDDKDFFRIKPIHLNSLNEVYLEDFINHDIHKAIICYVDLTEDELKNPEPLDPCKGPLIAGLLKKITKDMKLPLILHLPFIEHPKAFDWKGMRQYVYRPNYEEWKHTETRHGNPLINLLVDYIDRAKRREEKDYRWYWYFHRCPDWKPEFYFQTFHEGRGCDFPSCWMEGLHKLWRYIHLPMAQTPKNQKPKEDKKLSEIAVEKFKSFFEKGLSDDLVEEFGRWLGVFKGKI